LAPFPVQIPNGDYPAATHAQQVSEPLCELIAAAVSRFGAVSTMIDRDAHSPPLAQLCAELDAARALAARTLASAAGEVQGPRSTAAASGPRRSAAAPS